MSTLISAYEPTSFRYARLATVMTSFNNCFASERTRVYGAKAPILISLHEHKGALEVVTNVPLNPTQTEVVGLLWELQGEDRAQVSYKVG